MDIRTQIQSRNPLWNVNVTPSGAAQWVDIVTASNRRFTMQVTPNDGIGVSEISDDGLDFGGHDEVFQELNAALDHIVAIDN